MVASRTEAEALTCARTFTGVSVSELAHPIVTIYTWLRSTCRTVCLLATMMHSNLSHRLHSGKAAISHFARAMSSQSASSVFPTPQPLPPSPPNPEQESAEFEQRCAALSTFFALPRFASIRRPYPASAVASKQGSMPVLPLPSTYMADKLFSLLSKNAQEGKPVHTMGAIDPVQMTQMARNQEVVYISGWACSSVLTTGNNEVGPDFG